MISLLWNNLLAFEKYLIRTLKTGHIWLRGYSTQICWTSPPAHRTYSKVGRKQQASDFTITSLVFVSLFHPDLNRLARSSQSSPALSTLTLWLSMRVNHSVSLMSDFYKYPINLFKMPPKNTQRLSNCVYSVNWLWDTIFVHAELSWMNWSLKQEINKLFKYQNSQQ